ncbi:BPI fold-containing family B member 3-like [Columba livia]|uniref:BPI fold-containing family B member 3-like n=1 Tax=Columba livia TaxID=8932 RepID=UPI000A3B3247|nr:BPI fold-containing family B member 3-like [Columba livia]
MLTFWAGFLLCSLLTPGIMSAVVKVDVDDTTHSLAKRDLQKLPRNLLGGNLLGGLLGGDGPVGGLLGRDGPVGGLLGRDGPVGGLLGGNGVLGGLLGGDGLLGGLLGKNGVLGGVLDKDGILGGVTGKDGVIDGLLGKDGLIDGLLGKDGVVDGLLGKYGLLHSLLSAVIGKNGLLGKNGLVGNLLGGNNGDARGLRIVSNTLPKISLRSVPGLGQQVGYSTQLLVESTSAPGRTLCVPVEADVAMLVRDNGAALQNNQDCETSDITIRVRPQVPLPDQPLKRFLSDAVRQVACDIASARLGMVGSLVSSRTSAVPQGTLDNLPPFSILSADTIQLDVNLGAGDATGGVVAPAAMLLSRGHLPRLRLSPHVLAAPLEQLQAQGALDVSITSNMVPDGVLLSTAALQPIIPKLARILPGSLPLQLHVRVGSKPVVTIRDGRATTTLKATIDVVSPALQSASLFSLDTDIVLDLTPSVSNGRLQTSLALNSISPTRVPTELGPLRVSSLSEWIKEVLGATYIPAIRDAVEVSIPLPNVLSSSLSNVPVDMAKADDSLEQAALQGSCSRNPSALLAG